MKEIARWSRDEVAALLRAWREGLEHQPNPLRRGKLNGFVSERFHALRACYEPFRTACSIVYKKKYWKSMVQFICEYQEQSGDWFALSPAERKRCFGELKTTSYKFTDLEQDTAFEIAQLITLEDGTPGLADLVYVHSGPRSYDSNNSDSGGAWGGASPRDAAAPAMELDGLDNPHRRYPLSVPHMAYAPPAEKRGYRYGDYHDDASVTSSGSDDHGVDVDDDDDDGSELQYRAPSASSTPRSAIPSPLEFGDHPLLPASVSRYHQQREEVDDGAEQPQQQHERAVDDGARPPQYSPPQYSPTPDLLSLIHRLEAQAQQLKDMVQQERAERRRARVQQEAQQQAWEAEQEQHKKMLETLRGSQLESQESDKAKQAQHDEWAKVLQQLQLDRQERVQAQSARSADEGERHALLKEIRLSQEERHQMKEDWKAEQQQRAGLLDQIRQERLARNKDNSHWRVLLAQIKSERAVSDAKALSARHPASAPPREESTRVQSPPGASEGAAPAPAPVADRAAPPAVDATPSSSSKQETRAGGANPAARPPIKRSRPPAVASEDESRARGHRVRRV